MPAVEIVPNAKEMFQKLKTGTSLDWMTWRIEDDGTKAQVDQTGKGDAKEIVKHLPSDDLRFVFFDYGMKKGAVGLALWNPDGARAQIKVRYATTQESVLQQLEGVRECRNTTDLNDLEAAIEYFTKAKATS